MRGGLSAIQQTLTPEAASVLTHSIAEAGRRNHGQTTPLHVAATLLSSPTGFLRQACIRSHPNSSHPLQCRALELCFSVALERLPTAQNGGSGPGPGPDPPISNALMAALKRAQAHQRRGCPEQQQQPLLAVKVELEQLIISILDDPSVSRVMREASFSSPAVKAAIEQLVSTTQPNSGPSRPGIGLGFRPGPSPSPPGAGGPRSLYLNPRLQQQQQQQPHQQQQGNGGLQARGDDVKKVMDILSRSKKRNPILVGESGSEEVAKEVLRRIEKDEIHDGVLKGVEVVSSEKELGLDRDQLVAKVKELGVIIERKMAVNNKGGSGVIVDLGDLKWLVDQPPNQGVSEAAQGAVMEIGKIMRKCGEGGGKIWFIGAATCETYLRCQVYHPSWENEWDLQVVSIVARPPLSGIFPRFGSNGGILSSSVECLSPMKGFPMPAPSLNRRVSENLDPSRRLSCCPQCTEKYDQEYARLVAGQSEKPSSEAKSLPPWLQNAKPSTNDVLQSKEQDMILKQKTQELQKKWKDTCSQLHPSFHNNAGPERITPSPLSMMGLYNPNLLGRQPFQPKLQQPPQGGLGDGLQLNISSPATHQPNSENLTSKSGSPVRTELVLGPTKTVGTAQDEAQKDGLKDLLGYISSESAEKPVTAIPEDADSFKRMLKGLIAKVWWQTDAASAVAATVTQCRSGNGKRRAGGSKGDVWMLFSGPDRIGKKKLAGALSELVCDVGPFLFSLGLRHYGDESDLNFRGKTVIDRIVEAVRRNPFSVIMLQDIDEADMLVRGSIKRAMDRGRISDSHGREISLGNVIFIVTSKWMPDQLRRLSDGVVSLSEEKMSYLASGGWQLKISVAENATSATTITGKRPPSWRNNDDDEKDEKAAKQRKEELRAGLSFDLNQVADTDDDRLDGSHNSSDLTVEHEEELGHENRGSPTTSSAAPNDLLTSVDEAIFFKVVDFKPIRENIERSIITRFSSIVGETTSFKIDTRALEKILSGIWLGQTSLESWLEKVIVPGINQLKTQLPSSGARTPEGKTVIRLELDQESESRNHGDWLPGRVSVVTGAQ